jgi:hypothetical protein
MENLEGLPELRSAGLEGFELWDRTVRAPACKEVKVAFVSVRVGGVIGMNKAAYRMWGEPEACQVMYDPERRRIALRPVEAKPEDVTASISASATYRSPVNRSSITTAPR